MLEQIVNGDRQIIVRVRKPAGSVTMPAVVVRVAKAGQTCHAAPANRHRTFGAIRLDRASLSKVHKAEGLINPDR